MSARSIEAEVSIKSGVQAECSIGREVIVEVHDDVNLESLSVTANGQYEPSQGIDGWNRVTVSVPERAPVTESLSVTENGQYEPAEGVDGFFDVTVQVPERIPVTESLSVTQNGLYEPTEGIDGYNRVSVSVPERVPVTESLTVTSNGTYEPDSGVDGYNRVTVNVPERQPDIESLTVTSNGTYTSGKDGYNPVTVAVPPTIPDIEPLTVTENGTYTASGDGYNPVVVNVSSGAHNLPSAYTEYEYIEATGTQYIDTGYVPNADTEIIYTFQRTAIQGYNACEFGVTPSPKVVAAGRYVSLGGKTDRTGAYDPDNIYGYSTIKMDRAGLYDMLGRKTIDISDNTSNAGTLSLYVLARNNNGTAERMAKEKMRYFSASENGVKKIELIPAMRNSDGALGVYDTVRGVFLENAGAGAFLGEVVN